MTLSQLIEDGVDSGGHVVFERGGERAATAELLARGAARFSERSDASAVGILMTNDRATLEIVLGAIAAGATLVSLPLPGRGADVAAYAQLLRAACRRLEVKEVVISDEVAALLAGLRVLDDLGFTLRTHARLDAGPLCAPTGKVFQLVQFSSGSTHQPKPVALDDIALGANVEGIIAALAPQRGDVAVSWLPLSHDMGLIGMLLSSIAGMSRRLAGATEIVLLDPADFLRRPARWIEALAHWRATITASPDFGFRMASLRRPSRLADLSRLRSAIVGGEIVRAETLAHFAATYRGDGLRPQALCPAYGMAELGLAATITPPGDLWRSRTVRTRELARERLAAATATSDRPCTTLVASGVPLAGYEVACEAGPDATGRLRVRGPSIGVDPVTGASFADTDGWYATGDTGFLDDGWVYVCGRIDDYLVAHGRNIYAPAVEAAIDNVGRVRRGRVTAVGLPTGEWVIVAEAGANERLGPTETEHLRDDIRRAAVQVATAQPDDVVIVERGTLPLTPSGKLQRNEVRSRLLRGELARP